MNIGSTNYIVCQHSADQAADHWPWLPK